MVQKNILIDCDTGRDDALALWVALKTDKVKGVISSYGNVSVSAVVENNLRVLNLAQASFVPVFEGASVSLCQNEGYQKYTIERQKISGNGVCNVELPSCNALKVSGKLDAWVEFIQETSQTSGKLDYIVLGPATNFAYVAERLGNQLSKYLNSVTMLGGKIGDLWNNHPVPDFNVISDTDAFQVLLSAPIAKKLITLDTTWDIALSLEEIIEFEPSSEVGRWAKEIMISQCQHFAPEPIFRFHDPAAIFLYDKDELFIKGDVWFDNQIASSSFGRVKFTASPSGSVMMFNYNQRSCPKDIAFRIMEAVGLMFCQT